MLSAHELALINVVLPDERHGELCQKCGEKPLRIANMNIAEEIERIESEVRSLCQRMIVMHGNPPYSWDYFIIQRFSHYQDVSSDITLTSKQMKKIESKYLQRVKRDASALGATALVNFDVTINAKAMVFQADVITLKNTEVLLPNQQEVCVQLQKSWSDLRKCQTLLEDPLS